MTIARLYQAICAALVALFPLWWWFLPAGLSIGALAWWLLTWLFAYGLEQSRKPQEQPNLWSFEKRTT